MRKITVKKNRFARLVTTASLALALAAFGCTTNRYPGNGEPTGMGSVYGPTSLTSTPGSSSGTAGNPPMSSSYMSVPRVNTDALAILAAEQGFRGQVLGPANPGGAQSYVPLQPTGGQFVSPSMIVNPQSTVNSSISSPPTPVITGGGVGGGVTLAVSPTAGAPAATGAAPATAAATAAATSTGVAGVGVIGPSGTTGVGSTAFSPVVASGASFSPALMNSTPPPSATGSAPARPGATTASLKVSRPTTTAAARKVAAANASIAPIRIETSSTGQVIVTNAKVETKP